MSKKNYEEAKKFVLHNCYIDAYNCDCESEVTPFAWNYYKKYPFFNDCEYEIYFPKKGAHRTLTTHKPFFTLEEAAADNLFLGKRRQITSKGCFASKEKLIIKKNMQNKEKKSIVESWGNFKYLDLSADILTSIKTVVNKIQPNKKFETIERDFKLQKFNKSTIKKYFDGYDEDLKTSLFNFCRVCGTIGNMCPFPEGTNTNHGNPNSRNSGDHYFIKLNGIKYAFFKHRNNIEKDETSFINKWADFIHKESNYKCDIDGWKKFVNHFYLQDYFEKDLVTIKRPFDNDCFYPEKIYKVSDCSDWIKWLDFNTCLILKRGARIFSEGDEEVRKKLSVSLIEDKKLKEW